MASLDIINEETSTVVINLMDGTNYTVELGKEKIGVKTGEIQTVVYTINVLGSGNDTAEDNFNALVATLDEARVRMASNFYLLPFTLRRLNDGETSPGARAAIIDYDIKIKSSVTRGASQLLSPWLTVDLALTLYGWERQYATILNTTSMDGDGGNTAVSASAGFSTRNSRLHAIMSWSSFTVSKFWMGILPYRGNSASDMANFDPVWLLENGILSTDASLTTSTDSVGTYAASVSFVTVTSMSLRARISVSSFFGGTTTDAIVFAGQFMPLLRCRVTNADTDVFMRLGGGYSASEASYNEIVRLNGETDWVYIPMGVVNIPPRGMRAVYNYSEWGFVYYYTIFIDAEKNAGTGNLHVDGLIMIPYDHYVSVEGISTQANNAAVETHHDGSVEALSQNVSYYGSPTITGLNNWGFPYDNNNQAGILVVAAQRSDMDPGKTVSVKLTANGGTVFYA